MRNFDPPPNGLSFCTDGSSSASQIATDGTRESGSHRRTGRKSDRMTGSLRLPVSRILFLFPRIAPNTGNAIRMVAATGDELHLVEPLGFDLSEPKLRRAGLDYHDLATVTVHRSLNDAWAALMPARVFAFTAHASTSFTDIVYQPGDVLLFGPEPTGLDGQSLADPHITAQVRIPMLPGRRSLNLSNAAAVAAYEAWRQNGFDGASWH